MLLIVPTTAKAQLGSRYLHTDSLAVSTNPVDTTWTTPWEQVTILCDSVDVLMKMGAPDVGSWSSRVWMRINNGIAITIGPSPRLKKVEVKTITGTGHVYFIGYKKERQF